MHIRIHPVTKIMKRRTVLVTFGALTGVFVAGCFGPGQDNGTEDDDRDPDDDEKDSDQDDQDGNNYHAARFEVTGSNGGEDSASVTFENGSVTVTGTILGNNSCYTARLASVNVENRTLTISVESYEDPPEDAGCMQVIIGIHYEAVVEFDDEPPTKVTVTHNGGEVVTDQRS